MRLKEKKPSVRPGIRARMILSLGGGIAVILITFSLLNLFGAPFMSIQGNYQSHRNEIIRKIDDIAQLKKEAIQRLFLDLISHTRVFAEAVDVDPIAERFAGGLARSEDKGALLAGIRDMEGYKRALLLARSVLKGYGGDNEIRIVDTKKGMVIFSTHEGNEGLDLSEWEEIKNTRLPGVKEQVSFRREKPASEVSLFFIYPIAPSGVRGDEGIPSLAVMFILNSEKLLKPVLHLGTGHERSGEIILVDMNRTILAPLKYPLPGNRTAETLEYRLDTKSAELAAWGIDGLVFSKDYRGAAVITAVRHVRITPEFGIGLITKIDEEEVMAFARQNMAQSLLVSGLGIVFMLGLVYVLSGMITRPVTQLRMAAEKIMGGDLSVRASVKTRDEVGFLATAFNSMVEEIRKWHEELETKVRQRTAELDLELTERKRVEEQLRSTHQMADDIVRSIPSGLLIFHYVEPDKLFLLSGNPEAGRLTGFMIADYIGKDYNEVWPTAAARGLTNAYLEVMRTGKDFETEDLYYKDERLEGSFRIRAFRLPNERLAVSFESITVRKQAEEELRNYRDHLEEFVRERTLELEEAQEALVSIVEDLNEKSVQLEQAREQAQSADRLKSMFIASMSHELRTPLNSIIGFTGIILMGMSGPLSDVQRKQLGMVKNSANHLLDLINDVIDVSKIEAGKTDLSIGTFDLSDLAMNVKESFAVAASEKGLKLEWRTDGEAEVTSDLRRVKQILVNLLGNAVKFTETGRVAISVFKTGEGVEIKVSDTGIGMYREDMERLFQAFSRIHIQGAPIVEGTGLGLYLSRRLAALLGGEITAESEPGRGSVFTLSLPWKYPEGKE